jgi:hypothetical protein
LPCPAPRVDETPIPSVSRRADNSLRRIGKFNPVASKCLDDPQADGVLAVERRHRVRARPFDACTEREPALADIDGERNHEELPRSTGEVRDKAHWRHVSRLQLATVTRDDESRRDQEQQQYEDCDRERDDLVGQRIAVDHCLRQAK